MEIRKWKSKEIKENKVRKGIEKNSKMAKSKYRKKKRKSFLYLPKYVGLSPKRASALTHYFRPVPVGWACGLARTNPT